LCGGKKVFTYECHKLNIEFVRQKWFYDTIIRDLELYQKITKLVLTIIVELGMPDAFGNIMPVRGVGGGMVMGLA